MVAERGKGQWARELIDWRAPAQRRMEIEGRKNFLGEAKASVMIRKLEELLGTRRRDWSLHLDGEAIQNIRAVKKVTSSAPQAAKRQGFRAEALL